MGIATGESELRGDDYFGAVVNRAARLMAAGHGGQILIDGLTAQLLTAVDLLALGSRQLRDIARAVEIFQVKAPGLRSEFPQLRTVDSAPGNVRLPTTRLIGRDPELSDIASALKANRLVTLIGVGGVGKTRLAMEVAARSAPDFPDGVWVVELASVTDPAAVPDAAAAVLLANLAGVLYQLGYHESAATIAAFADDPLSRMAFSEIAATIAGLREVLGDDRYETLARTGRSMTTSEMSD